MHTRFTVYGTGTCRSCFPPCLSFHQSHPVISHPTSVSSVFTGWAIFTSAPHSYVLSRSALIFHIVLQLRWCLSVPHSYEGNSPINRCFMCQLNSVLFWNILDENEDCHHSFSCFSFFVLYANDAYNDHRLSSSKNNKSSAKTLEKYF